MTAPSGTRRDGWLELSDYAALGDGRSVALSGADGSIDWWCVPNMDAPPMFDRLLWPDEGGRFSITPDSPFTTRQSYRPGSNVHETLFSTETGTARLVESLNSGPAGRLPWCELARRIEGVEGHVSFIVEIRIGTRANSCSPYLVRTANGTVFHAGTVLGLIRHGKKLHVEQDEDLIFRGRLSLAAGESEIVAVVAGDDEPMVVPTIAQIDARVETSHREWRQWSEGLRYDGPFREQVLSSALALKLLLYSPSGAITAAATTSLPEKIGGPKNFDYRYAWVRDAGYTIKAFLLIGAQPEAKAAFTWLIKRLDEHGARVCYTLGGDMVPDARDIDLPGYRESQPVRRGNIATDQHQHGIYGDIFEVAAAFVAHGNVLDDRSARVLSQLADQCADSWMQKDSGIWELPELRHYTMSKISCWQALARAVELARDGHIADRCVPRWERVRDRIEKWIGEHCWSSEHQSYVAWAGSHELDASLALAVPFGFDGAERLSLTLDAIDRVLGSNGLHRRLTSIKDEEGCFLACSFWVVSAKAALGRKAEARSQFESLLYRIGDHGQTLPEMIDPETGGFLGNMPQGLSHLALIHAAASLG
ncbi:glycoside hydrolase family 15 protein [Novosphingobium terrae]|uniref:glycoside hydrolase family 15 protein n=1 Tax=Novosphingobium terrae TaxID=2726189 RepID=UPI0019809AF7|nr:glycoside hydrolase family 15 protein [Novosphingobium terrae]